MAFDQSPKHQEQKVLLKFAQDLIYPIVALWNESSNRHERIEGCSPSPGGNCGSELCANRSLLHFLMDDGLRHIQIAQFPLESCTLAFPMARIYSSLGSICREVLWLMQAPMSAPFLCCSPTRLKLRYYSLPT